MTRISCRRQVWHRRCGWPATLARKTLVAEQVRVSARVGANPDVKIGSLVAGMIAGAGGIDGMDLLRHGAIPATFGGICAPLTLGSFLRAVTHGTVRQLAAQTPLLPGAESLAFVDVDSVQQRVYRATRQGAGSGRAKVASKSLLVRGLGALVATVSTPLAGPVVTAARLRGGNAGSARSAASLVVEAINAVRAAGATDMIMVRADSAYYAAVFIAACRCAGAYFSVTVRMDPKILRVITSIDDGAWTPIKYPQRHPRRAGRHLDLRRRDRRGGLHRIRHQRRSRQGAG
jgi:hypothetical protein